jgi:hypothetical protein
MEIYADLSSCFALKQLLCVSEILRRNSQICVTEKPGSWIGIVPGRRPAFDQYRFDTAAAKEVKSLNDLDFKLLNVKKLPSRIVVHKLMLSVSDEISKQKEQQTRSNLFAAQSLI